MAAIRDDQQAPRAFRGRLAFDKVDERIPNSSTFLFDWHSQQEQLRELLIGPSSRSHMAEARGTDAVPTVADRHGTLVA